MTKTNENYVIDQVSWHTKVVGNPEHRDHIEARFWHVIDFMQRNDLTTKQLLKSQSDIDDDFAISTSDLTEKGMALMKAVYDKWLVKVDKGMSVTDLSMFEKNLLKL
ncbi:hypothetical protein [Herbaspirillum sp. NPDC101397]|uniref:hypothetical protein n=1 Tax=Herbaspirillum sp. NPDC101397 TaxID=3364006 RepID=UPI00383AAA5A